MVFQVYVQLSTDNNIPVSPERQGTKVYPLINIVDIDLSTENQIDTKAKWAILTSRENEFLSVVLKKLGFKPVNDDGGENITVIDSDGNINPSDQIDSTQWAIYQSNIDPDSEADIPKGLVKLLEINKYFKTLSVPTIPEDVLDDIPENSIIIFKLNLSQIKLQVDKLTIDSEDLDIPTIPIPGFNNILNFISDSITFGLGELNGPDINLAPSLEIRFGLIENIPIPQDILSVINLEQFNLKLAFDGWETDIKFNDLSIENLVRITFSDVFSLHLLDENLFVEAIIDGFDFDFFGGKTQQFSFLDVGLYLRFDGTIPKIFLKDTLEFLTMNLKSSLLEPLDLGSDLAIMLPTLKDQDIDFAFNFKLPFRVNSDFDINLNPLINIENKNIKFSTEFLKDIFPTLKDLFDRIQIFSPDSFLELLNLRTRLGDLVNQFKSIDLKFELQKYIPDNLTFNFDNIEILKFFSINIEALVPVRFPDAQDFNLRLFLDVKIDFGKQIIYLNKNLLYFYISDLYRDGTPVNNNKQYIDLEGVITLELPADIPQDKPIADEESHDGFVDLKKRGLFLQYKRENASNKHAFQAYIPGGVPPEGDELEEWRKKRFVLRLNDNFNPNTWPLAPDKDSDPDNDEEKYSLTLDPAGLSFEAELLPYDVSVYGSEDNSVALSPEQERDSIKSQVVIINNDLRKAVVYATTTLPGFNNVVVLVTVALIKEPNKAMRVEAELELEGKNKTPIGELSAKFLQMQLLELRLSLLWIPATNDWDLEAQADGLIAFEPGLIPGGFSAIEGVKSIQVNNLNLLNLLEDNIDIELNLKKPLEIDLLDGLFFGRISALGLYLDNNGEIKELRCRDVIISFNQVGSLQATVEISTPIELEKFKLGSLALIFNANGVEIELRTSVRIEVSISQAVTFAGSTSWGEDGGGYIFRADGTLLLEGLAPIDAALKIGSGLKNGGQVVPNVAIFAAVGDLDTTLFQGVVVKELGGGVGINNRLAGISPQPTPETLLDNIDKLDPSRSTNWTFVKEDGFYISIVAQTILASNPGGFNVPQAYVAWLVLSIDSRLDIIAAGKLWLASSVAFVKKSENFSQPVLVGAMALLPRKQTLRAALQSRTNPSIEKDPTGQLKRLFNRIQLRMSFFLSPDLVEYFLEDLSYREEFLGISMLVQGSYRVAIFSGAVFLKAHLAVTGSYRNSLRGGSGGFDFSGNLALDAGYGGIIRTSGILAYGYISASVLFRVSAFIEIYFKIPIIKIRRKGWRIKISTEWKKIGKTFRLGATSLELKIRGSAGFDTQGAFGFAGSVSISVSICGYSLSISPRLAFKEDVVERVQREVSSFERRIDRFKNRSFKALRESATELAPAKISTENGAIANILDSETTKKDWLLYQSIRDNETYYLLVPRVGTTWFTPYYTEAQTENPDDIKIANFQNHIKSFLITLDDDSKIEVFVPWDPDNWEQFPDKLNPKKPGEELYSLYLTFLESAQEGSESQIKSEDPSESQRIIYDPRVESDARQYWTYEDQFNLPETILPYEFRPIEELIAEGFNIAEQALEFERYQRRTLRERLHEGEDYTAEKTLNQTRSAILQMMLEDLQNPEQPQDFHIRIPQEIDESDKQRKELGYIFKSNKKIIKIQINTGSGYDDNEIDWDQPNNPDPDAGHQGLSVAEIMNQIELFDLRQKFVAADDTEDGNFQSGRGKVVVKLPIKISENLLKNNLESLNHFQIYRRLPTENEPKLVANFIQVDLTLVNSIEEQGQKVLLVDPYLYSDEFEVELDEFNRQKFTESKLNFGLREVLYYIRMAKHGETQPLPADSDDLLKELKPFPPVSLYIPKKPKLPKEIGIVFDVDSLIYINEDQSSNISTGVFQLVDDTDDRVEFAQINDAGKKRSLEVDDFELWVREEPQEQSGFYIGSEYQNISNGNRQQITNARQLASDTAYQSVRGKFKIDFENDKDEPNQFRLKLSSDSSKKLRVGYSYQFFIRPANSAPNALLRPLTHYVVRKLPKVWPSDEKLREIERLEWITDLEVKLIRNKEKNIVNQILPITVTPISNTQETLPLRWLPNHLRFIWDNVSLRDGGIEIIIRDRDETTLLYRQLCEVQKIEIFRNTQKDFRDPNFWHLTLWRSTEGTETNTKTESTSEIDKKINDNYGLSDDLLEIKNLEEKLNLLKQELDKDSDKYDWRWVLIVCLNWLDAVYQFLRSPTAQIFDSDLETSAELMTRYCRVLILGTKKPDSVKPDSVKPDIINELDVKFNQLLETLVILEEVNRKVNISESDISNAIFSLEDISQAETDQKAEELAFYDVFLANQIVAIARRRIACLKEIFTVNPEGIFEEIPNPNPNSQASEDKQEEARLEELRKSSIPSIIEEINFNLPLLFPRRKSRKGLQQNKGLEELYQEFIYEEDGEDGEDNDHKKTLDERANAPWSTKLQQAPWNGNSLSFQILNFFQIDKVQIDQENPIDKEKSWAAFELSSAGTNFVNKEIKNPDDEKFFAERLPKTKELDKFLQEFEEELLQMEIKVVSRPHHWLTTQINENGKVQPNETVINSLLPIPERWLTSPENINALTIQDVSIFVVHYFNVLERLGFAVDIEAVGEANQLVDWKQLTDQLRLFIKKEADKEQEPRFLTNFRIFVVPALEPDSALENQESAGFPFVKLALIPEDFYKALLTIADSVNSRRLLEKWFERRSIFKEEKDTESKYLSYLQFMGKFTQLLVNWVGEPPEISNTAPLPETPFKLITVEPANRRRLTVPAIGERSHSIWEVPDLRGHRYQVLARRVSRYEPLIQWRDGDVKPIQITTDIWKNDRIVEQVNVKRVLQTFDPESQEQLPAPLKALRVTTYLHPSLIRFSYQLPPEASRSIFNQISEIRTGYQGCDLNFEYQIFDQVSQGGEVLANDQQPPTLETIFEQITSDTSIPNQPLYELNEVDLSMNLIDKSQIRLFRNERLFALPHLPFFYRYRLNVQPLFDIRESVTIPVNPNPPQENIYPATRLPRQLRIRKSQLEKLEEKNGLAEFKWTIALSLNGDHIEPFKTINEQPVEDQLTKQEEEASPPALVLKYTDANGNEQEITADQIPDFAMSYELLYRIDNGASDNVGIPMIKLILPWAKGYQPPDTAPDTGRPFVQPINSDLIDQAQKYPQIVYQEIRKVEGIIREARYSVDVKFRVKNETFNDLADKSIFRAERLGASAIYPRTLT